MEDNEIIVWSKFCVSCIDTEAWELFEKYCKRKGWTHTTKRTSYIQEAHEQATALYGSPDYTIFLQKGRAIMDYFHAINAIKDGKELFEDMDLPPNKKVNIKKTKPVKKGKKK